MSNVLDAAYFLIDVINRQEEGKASNLVINKLLYFAQGISLSRTGNPLFSNQIEAWENGPVIQKIYHKFKKYKDNAIPTQKYDEDSLSNGEQDILLEAVATYGYDFWNLMLLSHATGSPWYKNYKQCEKEIPISNEDIKEYFIKTTSPKFYDESKVIELETDELGRPILPEEVEKAWGEYYTQ